MQKIRQYLIVVVLVLSLAALACGSSGESTPSRTATATEAPDIAPRSDATNTSQPPTATVEATETPAHTATPIPTNTPAPTNTRRATNAPRPTATPLPLGSVTQGVNLRAGPGTNYDKVGGLAAGEEFEIMGQTADGEWYCIKLGSGEVVWLAAFLVTTEAEEVPVVQADQIPPTPTIPPATNTAVPTATSVPPTSTAAPAQPTSTPQPAPGNVVIAYIYYDGQVPQVESDEYAEIRNEGGSPVNLKGWRLNADDAGQDFFFPDFVLQPGASCRVYTNEHHPESGGFSFGSGKALWANSGECGHLFDASGAEVSTYCY